MDAATGQPLPEFGLDVELEESSRTSGSGGGEAEGPPSSALARCPASLSHALVSGLLGGLSPRQLVEEYAREEGGREALVGRVEGVKAFFDRFEGWVGLEVPMRRNSSSGGATRAKREEGEGSGGGAASAAAGAGAAAVASTASLVVVGWWEA